MAVTSSTTSVAFMANYFSPLMPIQAFGVFAGTIIPVNYLLVVIIFPPATIFFERSVQGTGCCCINKCWKRKKDKIEQANSTAIKKPKVNKVESFFRNQWNGCIRALRWPIVILVIVWFQFALKHALNIGPLTESEEFVSADHPSQRSIQIQKNNFTRFEPDYSTVNFNFGALTINRTGDDRWNSKFVGSAIMDPNFDPKCESCQKALKNFCRELRKQETFVPGSPKCWFEDWD